MILEHLTVHCDQCSKDLDPTDPGDQRALMREAFRVHKNSRYPTFFDSHSEASTTVVKAGWYDDNWQTLCPRHYAAQLQKKS